jgi:3-mercaptopyruvate sulfurtransferase SseA
MLAFAFVSRDLLRDAALILVAAVVLGTVSNVLPGRGIPWWGQGKQPPQAGVDFQWLDAMSADALRVSLPSVVLVDSRPAGEFAAAHVEGAVSLPYTEIATELSAEMLDRLRTADAVILYGDTPDADTEQLMAQDLHGLGVPPPHILVGGLPAWQMNGLPVTEAAP